MLKILFVTIAFLPEESMLNSVGIKLNPSDQPSVKKVNLSDICDLHDHRHVQAVHCSAPVSFYNKIVQNYNSKQLK